MVEMKSDKVFQTITFLFSVLFLFFLMLFLYELAAGSIPTWQRLGLSFIFGRVWDPLKNVFGALPFLYGTLVSSTFALLLALPLGLGVAVFLSEIAPLRIRGVLSSTIELIAAIPSVVIGLWGIFVLAPFVRDYLQPVLHLFSFIPFFSGSSLTGLSMLTAILVLTFMITPIVATIGKDSLLMVPEDLKEGMYSLGARRYEVIAYVSVPYAKNGILGGLVLGYGRALGETMAVAMVIGNSYLMSSSLLYPGYTMAAVLANEFAEVTGGLYLSSLMTMAFLLLLISIVINLIGRVVILRWQEKGS